MSVLDERLARVLAERKERKREYLKKYREEHREAIRAYENGYRKRKVEQAMHKRWEQANREEQSMSEKDSKKLRCRDCGWTGAEDEIPVKTFYEDYGDVVLEYCPRCGAVEEVPGDVFEKAKGGRRDG